MYVPVSTSCIYTSFHPSIHLRLLIHFLEPEQKPIIFEPLSLTCPSQSNTITHKKTFTLTFTPMFRLNNLPNSQLTHFMGGKQNTRGKPRHTSLEQSQSSNSNLLAVRQQYSPPCLIIKPYSAILIIKYCQSRN